MEIKVNDYVRYKYEDCIYIGKIKFISEVMGFDETLQFEIDNCKEEILKQDIIKTSPRIIDLIEIGDYVNGWKVTQITNSYVEICWGRDSDEFIKPENIKSIVTKEMYSNVEYRVENN